MFCFFLIRCYDSQILLSYSMSNENIMIVKVIRASIGRAPPCRGPVTIKNNSHWLRINLTLCQSSIHAREYLCGAVGLHTILLCNFRTLLFPLIIRNMFQSTILSSFITFSYRCPTLRRVSREKASAQTEPPDVCLLYRHNMEESFTSMLIIETQNRIIQKLWGAFNLTRGILCLHGNC